MSSPPNADAGSQFGNEGTLEGEGGVSLVTRSWEPTLPGAAMVVIVHGLKDHSARYDPLARALTAAGVSVYAFDLRGHGRSGGVRAHVDRFADYLADLDRVVRSLRARRPTGPIFLLGHSMGGAIALGYLLTGELRFDGLILTGPAIAPPPSAGVFARAITRLLSALRPKARVFDLKDEAFSRDAETVAALQSDPYVFHGKATARLAAELLHRMAQSRVQLDRVDLPLLILHGSADRLTDPKGSELLLAQSRSRDKRLKVYPGWYHDLLHEPGRQEVVNEISEWLAIRLPAA
ncbi:MAG TPA: alpha/beta hydrolase [Thermoplasmata archaeon]|nr:alpha/beta hydrolase [Thermoplasmata archaeon]